MSLLVIEQLIFVWFLFPSSPSYSNSLLSKWLDKRFGCALRLSPLRRGLPVSSFSPQWRGSNWLIHHLVTPTTCKALIDAGYDVTVERSTQRIFDGTSNFPYHPYSPHPLLLDSMTDSAL